MKKAHLWQAVARGDRGVANVERLARSLRVNVRDKPKWAPEKWPTVLVDRTWAAVLNARMRAYLLGQGPRPADVSPKPPRRRSR